jgi:hypothetical protein
MEKTLQEKAEQIANEAIYLKNPTRDVFISGIKNGYMLHAQESKAMDDKYKKVAEALKKIEQILGHDNIPNHKITEAHAIAKFALINLESALKDLQQDKQSPMLPLVTKEQAILLKEVGFDLPTQELYMEGKDKLFKPVGEGNNNQIKEYYSAPTVSEALLWLEDNKGFQFFLEREYIDEDSGFMYCIEILEILTKKYRSMNFHIYNSRLFQSKQLSMALEILKSENK